MSITWNTPLVASTVGAVVVGLVVNHWLRRDNLRPNEPVLLPGSLPIFGHAIEFGKDANKLYLRVRDFADDLQPVSVSLMGQRVYIILKPQDVAAIWKAKAVNFDPIVEWGMHTIFGMSSDGIERSHLDDAQGTGDMFEQAHGFMRDALAPGEPLDLITNKFIRYVTKDIEITKQAIRSATGGRVHVSLLSWLRDRIGIPSTNAVVGENVLRADPGILEALMRMDSDMPRLSSGLPHWLVKDAVDNVKRLNDTFERELDKENVLYWMKQRMDLMAARGISHRDQTTASMAIWQALQTNSVPTVCWIIYQLLLHPQIAADILEEVKPAFNSHGNLIDLEYLTTKTPKLAAFYWETLRYVSGVVSVRKVMETFELGGRVLYKDALIMIPTRPYHMTREIFGDDCEQFVPDRFLRDGTHQPGKLNPGIRAVRPFGGGSTLCPGRHFATNEIFFTVATILRTFDIALVDPSQTDLFPQSARASVATLPPNKDVQVYIKLKEGA